MEHYHEWNITMIAAHSLQKIQLLIIDRNGELLEAFDSRQGVGEAHEHLIGRPSCSISWKFGFQRYGDSLGISAHMKKYQTCFF